LPGYTLSGIYKEVQKRFGESVENYIMASRCAQGVCDAASSTVEERESVLRNWKYFETEFVKKKTARHSQSKFNDRTAGPRATTTVSESASAEMQPREVDKSQETGRTAADRARRRQALSGLFRGRANSSPSRLAKPSSAALPPAYEEAIMHSVHETSHGDATEDQMIERALRASMVELKAAEDGGEEEQRAYERALDASIREAGRVLAENEKSMLDSPSESSSYIKSPSAADGFDQVEKRPQPPALPPRATEADATADPDLQAALAQSQASYIEYLQRDKSELDMVMEYVKRQSLAELEYERQRREKREDTTNDLR
jgi:hypothetical protein